MVMQPFGKIADVPEGWMAMSPSVMRSHVMDIFRKRKCNLKLNHGGCKPQLPPTSNCVISGGCLAHNWSGEPWLESSESNDWVIKNIAGNLKEFLEQAAPCECCSSSLQAFPINNLDDTWEEALEFARNFEVVINSWDKEDGDIVKLRVIEVERSKADSGWFVFATRYAVWVKN